MFNLTSSVPKSWQTVSRQADRVTNEATAVNGNVHHGGAQVPPPRDLGGLLRERREAMGASLAEVETATRIRQKYLAALEADEWNLLPGEVVGRGFLRNYATYLGLDPTEAVERRRTVSDMMLSAALSGTSAGSSLPPERAVDYRPKDVSLKDEPEGIQQRELRTGPFLPIVSILLGLVFLWWIVSNFGSELSAGVSNILAAAQTRGAEMRNPATPIPGGLVNAPNPAVSATSENSSNANIPTQPNDQVASAPDNASTNATGQDAAAPSALAPTPVVVNTEAPPALVLVPTDTPAPAIAETAVVAAEPTDTPEPEPLPTNTPEPLPTPTETPLPEPTETPAPPPTDTPPPVVAAVCGDNRMAFFTPSVGQVLSGPVSITGRAIHENLDYYKLEYAVGANAEGGFVYFDGNRGQVDGGILGTLNTGSLPNGAYTLQLTIVDLTGNYPAPCRVSIVIQN
ncbi:MAG: helix-turn-helix domain-containing protein [Caldilineaceae bacterium]|nr:helix-turn-helix domain-containing protein [Caldilineaceae bacterium]